MDNMQFLDPEQFNNNFNEKLDFKFILMRQIDKVRLSRSTEMRGGYWEDRVIPAGGGMVSQQIYIPDTRETYINAVKSLRSLLIPYWDEEFNKSVQDLKDKFLKEYKEKKEANNGEHPSNWHDRESVNLYDLIFEECLKLSVRAKLINGNNLIDDDI